jgi:hypothetical protein
MITMIINPAHLIILQILIQTKGMKGSKQQATSNRQASQE